MDQKDGSNHDLSLTAGPDGIKAGLTTSLLRYFFPELASKGIVLEAMADSIGSKIREGAPLDAEERLFVASMVSKDAKRHFRQLKAIQAAQDVSEEVLKMLPPGDPSSSFKTPGTFFERWREDVGLVTEGDVREIYSRVLAAEAGRPGTFSLSTLGVLRDLDPEVAISFNGALEFIVNAGFIVFEPTRRTSIGDYYDQCGFTHLKRLSLEDAGLLNLSQSSLGGGSQGGTLGDDKFLLLKYGTWLLLCRKRLEPPRLPVVVLAKAGEQLSRIVQKSARGDFISALGKYLRDTQPDVALSWAWASHAKVRGEQVNISDLQFLSWDVDPKDVPER